ncbi:MAG: hypothetical protein OXC62_09015 [Aestuariivita sp.]|nr:hypothetical protein [Aestuariivita sp.]
MSGSEPDDPDDASGASHLPLWVWEYAHKRAHRPHHGPRPPAPGPSVWHQSCPSSQPWSGAPPQDSPDHTSPPQHTGLTNYFRAA